jgi:uncharacterized protein YecT (DUF1311 family)
MKYEACLLAALAVIASSGCHTPGAGTVGRPGSIAPLSWQPAMERTDGYFAEALEHFDADQMELNVLTTQQAIALDGRLFLAYVRLWERLDEAGRSQLLREQKQWLKRRPSMARARNEYPEGSISPMTYNIAYSGVTREGVADLECRLQSLK